MRESRTFWNTFQKACSRAGGGRRRHLPRRRRGLDARAGARAGPADGAGDLRRRHRAQAVRPHAGAGPARTRASTARSSRRPTSTRTGPASLEPAALLKAMDDLGVERAVNLSGGFGPQLDRMLARYHDAAPGRLVIFANIDFSRIDEPTFAADHVAMLERAHRQGRGRRQDLQEPRADHQGPQRRASWPSTTRASTRSGPPAGGCASRC